MFKNKLYREAKLWVLYQRSLAVWKAETRQQKREHSKSQDFLIKTAADSLCTDFCPVEKMQEDGVLPFVAANANRWAEKNDLAQRRTCTPS